MIDYILSFPNEAIARAALADWRTTDEDGNSFWVPKFKCGIMEITVINQEAVWEYTDTESPVLLTAEILADGYWMAIATPEIDDDLWDKPYALSEHDRSLSATDHHLLRTKLSPEQIAGVQSIRPVFAGSNYPF
ncbi:MAG: hypothetical protein COA43_01390 [Robiginitomaculum sp.]|nr:MAG: hypothetical protein COA43_01390 [Robiginitomaculum sp.]